MNKLIAIITLFMSMYNNCVFGAIEYSENTADFPTCNTVWNKMEIALANYQDWTIDQSGGTDARINHSDDSPNSNKSVEINFNAILGMSTTPHLVIRSKELSDVTFNDIKALSLLLQSESNIQVRIVLRDKYRNLFSTKKPIQIHNRQWAEIKKSNATDSVIYHSIANHFESLPPPQPPFSIDHIKIRLRDNYSTNNTIKLNNLGVFEQATDARPLTSKSPYASWIGNHCNLSSDGADIELETPILRQPLEIGSTLPISVFASNHGNTTLTVKVNSFGGQTQHLTNEIYMAKTPRPATKELQHTFNQPGLYAVSALLTNEEGELLARKSREIMVWSPPGNHYDDNMPNFFGMMYHDRFTKSIQKDFKLMADAGVRIVRFPFRWSETQPNRDTYNWHNYDSVMGYIRTYDMIAQPMLFYTPNWAGCKPDDIKDYILATKRPQWVTPCNPDDVANFIDKAAKRYANQPVVWEIYNEPTETQHWIGGDEKDYVNIFNAVAGKIQDISPKPGLITAGIGIAATKNKKFTAYVAHNINGAADGFAIHSYGGAMNATLNIETAKELLLDSDNDTDVWLNETGYLVDAADPEGELLRSAALAKTAIVSRYLGAANFTWFIFKNHASSSQSASDNYALTSHDGSIRAPILAYANVAKLLHGAEPIQELDIGKAIKGYEFSIGSKRLLVTWLNHEYGVENFQPPNRNGMSISKIYDVFGGAINTSENNIQLEQMHYPLFLVYEPN